MFNFRYLYFTHLCLLLTTNVVAQSDTTLNHYHTFISNVRKSLEEFKRNQLDEEKAENAITLAKSIYDPRLYSEFRGYGLNNYDDFSNNEIYTVGIKPSVGIEKKLRSGTSVSSEFTLDLYQNRGEMESWKLNESSYQLEKRNQKLRNRTISPELRLLISQPLLKNRGAVAEKFSVNSALYQFEAAKLTATLNNMTVLNHYRKLYVKKTQLASYTTYMNEMITTIKKQKSRAKRLLHEGLLDKDEYIQFCIFSVQLDEQIMQNETEITDKVRSIVTYLPSSEPNYSSLLKIYDECVDTEFFNLSFDSTSQGRLFTILTKEAQHYVQLRKQLNTPELNIYGEGTFKHYSNRHKRPTKSERKNLGLNFTVGAQFTMAIGNRKTHTELREAQLNMDMIQKEREISRRKFNQNYELIITYFTLYQNLIQQKQKVIETLEEKAKAEQLKFRQARIDHSDLIKTQSTIIEERVAQNNYRTKVIHLVFDYISLIN